mgnify:CR=1 FL=1
MMTISEQIKVLCVRQNISLAELARRLGKSPQSFNSKMRKQSFTVDELEKIAEVREAAREGAPITLIDGNDLIRLVIKYELYITPVTTYVLDGFYTED